MLGSGGWLPFPRLAVLAESLVVVDVEDLLRSVDAAVIDGRKGPSSKAIVEHSPGEILRSHELLCHVEALVGVILTSDVPPSRGPRSRLGHVDIQRRSGRRR